MWLSFWAWIEAFIRVNTRISQKQSFQIDFIDLRLLFILVYDSSCQMCSNGGSISTACKVEIIFPDSHKFSHKGVHNNKQLNNCILFMYNSSSLVSSTESNTPRGFKIHKPSILVPCMFIDFDSIGPWPKNKGTILLKHCIHAWTSRTSCEPNYDGIWTWFRLALEIHVVDLTII